MSEISEDKTTEKVRDPRVYMANEGIYLAWIRSRIGIMHKTNIGKVLPPSVRLLSYDVRLYKIINQ